MEVTAKSNIMHDGELYTKGQSFSVSEKQAADLLAAGAIEPVKGLKPTDPDIAPAAKSVGTPDDKTAENKGIEEVANLPFNKSMGKEKLIGIARAKGIVVEKTATKDEVLALLEANAKPTAENKGEDVVDASKGEAAETTPGGAESTVTAGEPQVPANPAENAPAQNTTDTQKEPAPAPSTGKKSK